MIVRQATTRDLFQIIPLFGELIHYLRKEGNGDTIFADDANLVFGGITEFLAARVNMQLQGESVRLLVGQDEATGSIVSFLSGIIAVCPRFCRHERLGDIEYVYPLSFQSTPLVREFDAWAQSMGATARICRGDVKNARANEVYKTREKSLHAQNVYLKTY